MVRFGAALLVLAGCLEPELVLCEDGRACPIGTTCLDALATCVSEAQISACAGLADGSPCTLEEAEASCVEGACFERRCGDGIVEAGEVCDDGNLNEGDGCSVTCSTIEQCGDGVLETQIGEACDDGNSVSGDGCDSRCLEEQIVWTVRQCGEPSSYATFDTAFDVRRNRLVAFWGGWLYEWDGSTWQCSTATDAGTALDIVQLEYDPVLQRVLLFRFTGISAWDGTTFTTLVTHEPTSTRWAVYDTSIAQYLLYDQGTIEYWDPVTLAFTPATPNLVPTTALLNAAYDAAADRIIAVIGPGNTPLETWTWERATSTWTQQSPTWSVQNGPALAYHAGLGKVVAFGGWDGAATTSTMYSWSGTDWEVLATSTEPGLPRQAASLEYDPSTTSLIAVGGGPDVYRYTTTWSRWTFTDRLPNTARWLASLGTPHELLAGTSDGQTWHYDGMHWSQLVTANPPPTHVALRSDNGRLAGYDASGRISEFDGADWITVAMLPAYQPLALTFDPGRGALAMYSNGGAYAHVGNDWVVISDYLPGNVASLAYDEQHDRLALSLRRGINLPSIYRLEGGVWELTFSFPSTSLTHPPHHALAMAQRGTVWYASRIDGSMWENNGESWRRFPPYFSELGEIATFDVTRGEAVIGNAATGRIISVGLFSATTPRESCNDGEDIDGDGRAACDDQDCFWRCAPSCPPYSSCF